MRRYLAGLLSERARLFLLALAIAVSMWYYVGSVMSPSVEAPGVASLRVNRVEVAFSGLAPGWSATSLPRFVDVEIRWPADAVLTIRPTDVRAIADVGMLEPGPQRVALRIELPTGVTGVRANPPAVVVHMAPPP